MIHGILPVQYTCLTVFFHGLSPSCLWSTCWPGTLHFILHTFHHPIIIFFLQHTPIPSQPVCCSTEIMSSNPSLCLNPLLGTRSCSFCSKYIYANAQPLRNISIGHTVQTTFSFCLSALIFHHLSRETLEENSQTSHSNVKLLKMQVLIVCR